MPSHKLTLAQVSWTVEAVPKSDQFDDFYFSTDGGQNEVEHTFIKPNNLQQRYSEVQPNKVFRIAETGFGSGLNFLMACDLWLKTAHHQATLHYLSFEKYPLHLKDLTRAHQILPGLVGLASALQKHYPLLLPGWHDVWLFEDRIRLTLWFGDVQKGLPECDASQGSKIDAWFLDGFAPAKNPDMWQASLYQQMARLSHLKTTFATFTAAGEVRRGLEKAGFEVKKSSGYGKKREICSGILAQQRPYSLKAPWFSRPAPITPSPKKTAVVIGAGLAGAAVVNQLAKAGWQVEVLEAEKTVASQASGNLAGALHPLITADWSLRSQWYLQGFEATLRTVLPWLTEQDNREHSMGDLSGLVQLAVNQTGVKRVEQAFERVGLPAKFVRKLTQDQASEMLGTPVAVAGLLFPQGGWLYPKALIKKCLEHDNVTLHTQQPVNNITQIQKRWLVKTASHEYQADIVVVATGSLEKKLNQKLGLPIRPVKGQVSHIKPNQQAVALKKAVTHEGYSVSYGAGGAVTGATFEAPDMSQTLSQESHQFNIDMTQKALPGWLTAQAKDLTGRIAFRPTTPDHLPIVGPIACCEWMQTAYLSQSHTHAVYRYQAQQYQTGLYVSNGHGPRGLMSVFLAAETLTADIEGKALPQPLSLYHASHPARFQIRNWRSGQTK